jgi:hypothetical protein
MSKTEWMPLVRELPSSHLTSQHGPTHGSQLPISPRERPLQPPTHNLRQPCSHLAGVSWDDPEETQDAGAIFSSGQVPLGIFGVQMASTFFCQEKHCRAWSWILETLGKSEAVTVHPACWTHPEPKHTCRDLGRELRLLLQAWTAQLCLRSWPIWGLWLPLTDLTWEWCLT